ncbi:hypothetical protein [Pseudomonas coronafaciens]|uniref:hypothetical protein n=1 Tax=Pseudomonas coronafaciens TaxID=53409 RepID=UPI000E3EC43B|nr:hypothetical protein [Pseudomonas coronafaciens]
MSTYALTGRVIDDDGVSTIVDEFTTSARRVDQKIKFYKCNAFTGTLILITTGLDGTKDKHRILLDP